MKRPRKLITIKEVNTLQRILQTDMIETNKKGTTHVRITRSTYWTIKRILEDTCHLLTKSGQL